MKSKILQGSEHLFLPFIHMLKKILCNECGVAVINPLNTSLTLVAPLIF